MMLGTLFARPSLYIRAHLNIFILIFGKEFSIFLRNSFGIRSYLKTYWTSAKYSVHAAELALKILHLMISALASLLAFGRTPSLLARLRSL